MALIHLSIYLHLAMFLIAPAISKAYLTSRQACVDEGFSYCTGSSPPSGGGGLPSSDASWLLLGSIGTPKILQPGDVIRRSFVEIVARQQDAICCSPTTECKVLTETKTPLCYNPTTTEFGFSDGSYGFANTGEYHDPAGNVMNLNTGDYTLTNGTKGNYYSDNNITPPSTSTTPPSITNSQGSFLTTTNSPAPTGSPTGSPNGVIVTGAGTQTSGSLTSRPNATPIPTGAGCKISGAKLPLELLMSLAGLLAMVL